MQIAVGNGPEAIIGQATINLIHKIGSPLRIPYPSGTALLSGAYVTQESWARGFLWVRKVWFVFAKWTFASETLGERRKGERSPVVSLLPGSPDCLALRNPHVLCQKHGLHVQRTTLECQRYKKTGQEIRFPCSQERRKEISQYQLCKDTRIRK